MWMANASIIELLVLGDNNDFLRSLEGEEVVFL